MREDDYWAGGGEGPDPEAAFKMEVLKMGKLLLHLQEHFIKLQGHLIELDSEVIELKKRT